MSNFFQKLQRRNVIKAAITFAVVAWAIIQVAQILFETFEMPPAALRYVLFILIGLFPFWIIFAFVFEWTPSGFKKTEEVAEETSVTKQTGKRLNTVIISGLIIAVLLLVADRVFDLTGRKTQTSGKGRESIAVLPFVDLSQNKDQEYFSDGLSEELLNLLAKLPDLKVIARTSSFSFKGKNEDLRTIGEKLGVAHILEGSVRKSGNKLRITAQLIKVDDGTHLWSETYDRTLDDIFKVQDEISSAVVSQLKLKLLGSATQVKVVKPEAYNLYLEGKFFVERKNNESYKKAIDKLKAALALDPNIPEAWVQLSSAYAYQADLGVVPVDEGYARAKETVEKALQLNPNLAEAHAQLGSIHTTYDFDFVNADLSLKKALELGPNNAEALKSSALLLRTLGRLDEAISFSQKASASDPLLASSYLNLSIAEFFKGDYDNAEASVKKCLELAPGVTSGYYTLSLIELFRGHDSAALKLMLEEKTESWRSFGLPVVYFKLGRKAEADAALKVLLEKYSDTGAYQIAEAYAQRSENDAAFEWLNKAYNQRDGGLHYILGDPQLRNLHKDARWLPFLQKVGLGDYWPAYKEKYLR